MTALSLGIQAAYADDPNGEIHVKGNVPAVCSLGGWQKQSGPGAFVPGFDAVATYNSSDLVGADGFSALGPGSALTFHAPLSCNTAITWSFSTAKGALRLDATTAAAPGFARQWFYDLSAAPYTQGGSVVGFQPTLTSNGTPITESFGLGSGDAKTISYMGIVFSPIAQPLRMLAGNYSETITLTVSPTM